MSEQVLGTTNRPTRFLALNRLVSFYARLVIHAVVLTVLVSSSAVPLAAQDAASTRNTVSSTDQKNPLWFVAYLPTNTFAVAKVSFEGLAAKRESRPLYEALRSNPGFIRRYGVSPAVVSEMIVFVTQVDKQIHFGAVLKARDRFDLDLVKEQVQATKVTPLAGGQLIKTESKRSIVFEETQLVEGDTEVFQNYKVEGVEARGGALQWVRGAGAFPKCELVITFDPSSLSSSDTQLGEAAKEFVGPLVDHAEIVAVALQFDGRAKLFGVARYADDEQSLRAKTWIEEQVNAGPEDVLDRLKQGVGVFLASQLSPVISEWLKSLKIRPKDNSLGIAAECDFSVQRCRKLLAVPPAFDSEDQQLLRTGQHLSEVFRGLRNYHAANGRLPPAVLVGPDGKTTHSWRVAILPYIDNQDLYRQYRLTEAWDSDHNRKLLELAPDCFRSPTAAPDSVYSSYFVLTGKRTPFSDPNGISAVDVPGQLRETALVIESTRNIPWTKPEDIEFDPAKELPELGGIHKKNFWAVLGSGTIRGTPLNFDAAKLKERFSIPEQAE